MFNEQGERARGVRCCCGRYRACAFEGGGGEGGDCFGVALAGEQGPLLGLEWAVTARACRRLGALSKQTDCEVALLAHIVTYAVKLQRLYWYRWRLQSSRR